MKYKHTLGPWKAVDKRPNSPGFSIFSGSQYIGFVGDSDSKTNCAGNAHLIAAAPELLDLLMRYRNETPINHQPHMIVHLVDEIIAKIKGEGHEQTQK